MCELVLWKQLEVCVVVWPADFSRSLTLPEVGSPAVVVVDRANAIDKDPFCAQLLPFLRRGGEDASGSHCSVKGGRGDMIHILICHFLIIALYVRFIINNCIYLFIVTIITKKN